MRTGKQAGLLALVVVLVMASGCVPREFQWAFHDGTVSVVQTSTSYSAVQTESEEGVAKAAQPVEPKFNKLKMAEADEVTVTVDEVILTESGAASSRCFRATIKHRIRNFLRTHNLISQTLVVILCSDENRIYNVRIEEAYGSGSWGWSYEGLTSSFVGPDPAFCNGCMRVRFQAQFCWNGAGYTQCRDTWINVRFEPYDDVYVIVHPSYG